MKIATTIGEMYPFCSSHANAIRQYEGTGFKYFDYSFYGAVLNSDHPLMRDDWKEYVYKSKEAADELGFAFVQAHAPACDFRPEGIKRSIEAVTRSIEACKILGIKNTVIHSAAYIEYKYPQDKEKNFIANEPFFRALIPAMERNEVSVLFENTTKKHLPNGEFFPITGQDLNDFIEFMNHPLFGAGWDVGHAHLDGLDQYKEIMTMGKNLKALHIHDNLGSTDVHMAPFTGNIDFDAIICALIDSSYEGYFTFEADGFFKRGRIKDATRPLSKTPIEVKKAAMQLLHCIGKTMLEKYNIYED